MSHRVENVGGYLFFVHFCFKRILLSDIEIGRWNNKVLYCSQMNRRFGCVHRMDENVCGECQVNGLLSVAHPQERHFVVAV